jgi:antitoxin CcdA
MGMQEKANRKKAVNLSIDAKLAAEAKMLGSNLSAVLEDALKRDVSEKRWQKWRQENREGIKASNAELEKNGMWYSPDWLGK